MFFVSIIHVWHAAVYATNLPNIGSPAHPSRVICRAEFYAYGKKCRETEKCYCSVHACRYRRVPTQRLSKSRPFLPSGSHTD